MPEVLHSVRDPKGSPKEHQGAMCDGIVGMRKFRKALILEGIARHILAPPAFERPDDPMNWTCPIGQQLFVHERCMLFFAPARLAN